MLCDQEQDCRFLCVSKRNVHYQGHKPLTIPADVKEELERLLASQQDKNKPVSHQQGYHALFIDAFEARLFFK